mmetsp:Transcript_9990/g.12347  ORF Transcript_9990/g.12347 Transcript_9990/m.12347 type:complete len:165 (-) Transcript_9990:109-603(-)|eukprot:CAMPEP_0172523546 /NCGR_PEP_ID=MMETSP1066-20121228/293719_1 /TAXON_ID=671091 /ORGANISM="Coscinodiscus wailesii, Strain CCMP2513" /LENGTH=164 /DNA_ID=CAMNT_0013306627 /DNA_START=53 /DNA_END=547 /DNA_ORIENTATION=-
MTFSSAKSAPPKSSTLVVVILVSLTMMSTLSLYENMFYEILEGLRDSQVLGNLQSKRKQKHQMKYLFRPLSSGYHESDQLTKMTIREILELTAPNYMKTPTSDSFSEHDASESGKSSNKGRREGQSTNDGHRMNFSKVNMKQCLGHFVRRDEKYFRRNRTSEIM